MYSSAVRKFNGQWIWGRELEAQIRSFLNYLRVEKGLSANTLHAYRRDMEKFAAFAAKQKPRFQGD